MTDKITFEVVDVEGDGSCFFRSIYNYLKYSNINRNDLLKNEIYKCIELGDKDDTENKFVKKIREKISSMIMNEETTLIKDLFETMSNMEKETYKELYSIENALPDFVKKRYKLPPKQYDTFKKNYADSVKKNSHYATEFEFNILLSILRSCVDTIELNITMIDSYDIDEINDTNANYPRLIQKVFSGMSNNTIYLVNISNEHYNYLKLKENNIAKKVSPISKLTSKMESLDISNKKKIEKSDRVLRSQVKK